MNEEILSDGFYDEDEKIETEWVDRVRCLTFRSGEMTMFMSTEYVKEIINGYTVTPLPMVPDHVKGIINLRGKLLPVVDMQRVLTSDDTKVDVNTCMIVLKINGVSLAILVDEVQQVEDIDFAKINPIPHKNKRRVLSGMTHLKNGSVAMAFDCQALLEME